MSESTTPTTKARYLALVLIVMVLIGASVFFSNRAPTAPSFAPLKTLTLATFDQDLGNSPCYIIQRFHWLDEDPTLSGVAILYKEYNDRPAISQAFRAGDLQVLFSADVPALHCRAEGSDIRIVALSASVSQNILVRRELPLHKVEDLRGRKLAVLRGTSSQYCVLKMLKVAGLKETDLDLLNMGPAEARTAFETDRIDAWAVWAPFEEQQEIGGKGRLISGGDAVINSTVSMSTPFVRNHPAAARAVISAISRAKQWILDHPNEAQQIAAKHLGLDAKVVKAAWPKYNWAANLNTAMVNEIKARAMFINIADKAHQKTTLRLREELVDVTLGPNIRE